MVKRSARLRLSIEMTGFCEKRSGTQKIAKENNAIGMISGAHGGLEINSDLESLMRKATVLR